MGSDRITTVSVSRSTTYRELRQRRNDLESLEPGESASMDDVIRSLLNKAEELEELREQSEMEPEALA